MIEGGGNNIVVVGVKCGWGLVRLVQRVSQPAVNDILQ